MKNKYPRKVAHHFRHQIQRQYTNQYIELTHLTHKEDKKVKHHSSLVW